MNGFFWLENSFINDKSAFSKMWEFLLSFNTFTILRVMKLRKHISFSYSRQKLQQGNILKMSIATTSALWWSACAVPCGVLMRSYKRLRFPLSSCALRQGRYISVFESCHRWEQQLIEGVEKDKAASLYGKRAQWSRRETSAFFSKATRKDFWSPIH